MQPARAPEHEPDGRGVGGEADAARGRLEAEAGAVDGRDHDHEQEVGRAVDGLLADVPDDAVAGREVVRVAQQHRRVLFGPAAQVEVESGRASFVSSSSPRASAMSRQPGHPPGHSGDGLESAFGGLEFGPPSTSEDRKAGTTSLSTI